MKPAVLFETISEIVDGEYTFRYEDALQRSDIRKQVSVEIMAGKDPALDSGTGHLMVKGWEEGVYYPYPLLFWSHADRARAAEHFRTTYGGDQHFYIPSDDEVFGRVKEIEDYILMVEQ